MISSLPLHLAPGWTLGADLNQWILLRRRKRQDETYDQAMSFIGSTKSVLCRILQENSIQPTAEAQIILNAMPERFLDWRNSQDRNSTDQKTKQPPVAPSDCLYFITHTSLKDNAHDE